MGNFRFWKRIKLCSGIFLNIGKKSGSVSVGPKGLKYTIGLVGRRFTISIPGTGLYYTIFKSWRKK